MKRILFTIVASLFSIASFAKAVDMGGGLTLEMPGNITALENDACIYAGYDSLSVIIINKLDKGDFDTEKVKENLARILFKNLKYYVEVDSESDGFFELGKDYKIAYLRNDQGRKVAVYTSYVCDFSYCILIDYEDDAAIKTLRSIADSERYNSSWWNMVQTFYCRDKGVLCLAFFILVFVCIFIESKVFGLLFGTCLGILISIPLWGAWGAWLFYVSLGAIFGVVFSKMKMQDAMQSMIDGIG